MGEPAERITTYAEFWPFYLQEHSKRATKIFHVVGTLSSLAILAVGMARGTWLAVPLALVAGYGPAWFSHFFIEKNRPATFTYPLWSFLSDFRMLFLVLTGRL